MPKNIAPRSHFLFFLSLFMSVCLQLPTPSDEKPDFRDPFFLIYFPSGALLNRLPLLKRLQLREVVAFRGWYGTLTDKNNPFLADNADLYAFPSNTYLMGRRPYMELSVGLDNILKLVRVDYVWRLSYRDHPHTPNSGVRFKVQFSF